MKVLMALAAAFVFGVQINTGFSGMEFLQGTWKVEGKEEYETWESGKNGELNGYSYKINGNEKEKTEILAIKFINHQMVYEATVPAQNDGRTIQFILNTEAKSCFSFENPEHDFPKKIQYEKKSDNEIQIRVLGHEGNGFSYKLIRQK